jgi:hypothetical protein
LYGGAWSRVRAIEQYSQVMRIANVEGMRAL